jgi:hypothetical protein
MLQKRVAFASSGMMSFSLIDRDFGIRRSLRSPQVRVGVLVVASLLGFGIIAARPDTTYPTMQLVLTYNAVVLGYLSAFWGLWTETARDDRVTSLPYSSRRIALAERDRLLWSVAPTVLGGSGMLLPLILPQDIGTLMLVTGFTLLVALEALGQRRGVPAADFKWLRWSVSIAAIVILIDVLANQRWAFRILF